MGFPKLVTDNTFRLLLEEGRLPISKPMLHTESIFDYLKEKVREDFERMLSSNGVDKKVNALADLYNDLNEYKAYLATKMKDIDRKMLERTEKMGGFTNKDILVGIDKGVWTHDDVAFAMKEGERLNYCKINLSRNEDGKVFKTTESGKEAWDKILESRFKVHCQNMFAEFIAALRRGDYEKES